jgi:hypothetical protein
VTQDGLHVESVVEAKLKFREIAMSVFAELERVVRP